MEPFATGFAFSAMATQKPEIPCQETCSRGIDINRESLGGAVVLSAKILSISFALAVIASQASASILTSVSTSPGTPVTVDGIERFMVSNADMGPFVVTAWYSDSTVDSTTWVSGSGTIPGKAETARFLLTEFNDTYFYHWQLNNLDSAARLVKLEIDGLPGGTVFDLHGPTFYPGGASIPLDANAIPLSDGNTTPGTPDSEKGRSFSWLNASTFVDNNYDYNPSVNVRVTYSDIVNITSQPAVGDLWRKLTIEFYGGSADGLLGPSGSNSADFRFYADTDLVRIQANEPVPEPSAMLAFASLGLVAAYRRRRHRSSRALPA